VYAQLSRPMNLLDPPRNLLEIPIFMQSLLASYERRGQREKVVLGASRKDVLECFAALDIGA
jgi:hypothetical protein